jgi:phage gp45-like
MANERQTLQHLSNQLRLSTSRATVREFDDEHLMQQVKHADVYHSETPSDFERWQMVGLTSTPLKQDEDDNKQQQNKTDSQNEGDWNHNQPKGKAAEAIMLYIGGARSHPIALVDDRRVRPYKVPEGGAAFYAPTGTGQMLYHNDDGSHLVVTNNPKYGKNQQEKERYASVRHVKKKPQDRNIGKGGQSGGGGSSAGGASAGTLASSSGGSSSAYKHEGEEILTETRHTSGTVETRDGDNIVGVYNKSGSMWDFKGQVHQVSSTDQHIVTTKNIKLNGSTAIALTGPTSVNGNPVATTDMLGARDKKIAALEERVKALEARLNP